MSAHDFQATPSRVKFPRHDPRRWLLAIGACAVLLLFPPALLIALFWLGMQGHPAGCEVRQVLAHATSPDGIWEATVYDTSRTDGGFATVFVVTVEIARPGEKTSSCPSAGTVFAMDASPYTGPIAVSWAGPRSLEVSIPSEKSVGKKKLAFADVTVSYRHIADDPVEKGCWERWRMLPNDEAAKSRSGPASAENAEMFLAKCRAQASTK
jgi:hypothetical protein